MPSVAVQKEYTARADSKKRLTIREADFQCYDVVHRKDGTILLKPREEQETESVPPDALRSIAKAVASMKAGKRSKPVDLKKLAALKM